jgi:hypothetical protein
MRIVRSVLTSLLLAGSLVTAASAEEFEVAPYAGGFVSGKVADVLSVNNQPMYGIKGGWFTNKNFEIEGHFGYINNLSYAETLTRKRAYIWEGLATYNVSKFYGSFGLGGVTTSVSADSVEVFGDAIPRRDKFMSMSYGGGLKVLRKWGPVGYRFDIRGRTLPNYNGFAYSWLETTGGLTFSWGER